MKASELIQQLARAIGMSGDQEVLLEIRDHDGHNARNVRTGGITMLIDTTWADRPFKILSQKQVPAYIGSGRSQGDADYA